MFFILHPVNISLWLIWEYFGVKPHQAKEATPEQLYNLEGMLGRLLYQSISIWGIGNKTTFFTNWTLNSWYVTFAKFHPHSHILSNVFLEFIVTGNQIKCSINLWILLVLNFVGNIWDNVCIHKTSLDFEMLHVSVKISSLINYTTYNNKLNPATSRVVINKILYEFGHTVEKCPSFKY